MAIVLQMPAPSIACADAHELKVRLQYANRRRQKC